jgi:1,4-alpha-glucan branching enzyme
LRHLYYDLSRLRASAPALRGRITAASAHDDLLWIHRTDGSESALVILNVGPSHANQAVAAPADGDWTIAFNTASKYYGNDDAGSSGKVVAHGGQLRLEIDAWSAMVLLHEKPARGAV